MLFWAFFCAALAVPPVTLEQLLEKRAGHERLFAVMLLAREDKQFDRIAQQLDEAVAELRADRSVDGGAVEVFLCSDCSLAQAKATFNVSALPVFLLFDGDKVVVQDGRPYKVQVLGFLRRHLLQKLKKVSALLKDQGHFGRLLYHPEPVVVYCGPERAKEFEMFETIAKGSDLVYYHSFDLEFCTNINLMRVDKIRELNYTVREEHRLTDSDKLLWVQQAQKRLMEEFAERRFDQEELNRRRDALVAPEVDHIDRTRLNQTLWDLYAITRPSVFVLYKTNGVFDVMQVPQDLKTFRASLKIAAISNFFTQTDKAYDHSHQNAVVPRYFWLGTFTDDLESEACRSIKQLSQERKLTDPEHMFACLPTSAFDRFRLEIKETMPRETAVYYWYYRESKTNQQASYLRPKKHRLLSRPAKPDVEAFYEACKAGRDCPEYYFDTPPAASDDLPFMKALSSSTLEAWLGQNLETRHLVLLTHSGASRTMRKLRVDLEAFAGQVDSRLGFAQVDLQFNELFLHDDDDSVKAYLWNRGSGPHRFNKVINIEAADAVVRAVGRYILDEEVRQAVDRYLNTDDEL